MFLDAINRIHTIPGQHFIARSPQALGIEAASFWSVAEKDRAESPTALPERPKKDHKTTRLQDN